METVSPLGGVVSMSRWLAIAAGAAVLVAACTPNTETADRQQVIGAIQKAEQAQEAALARNDLDGAVTGFASDATLYVPGMPPAHGREAIKAANERALIDPAMNVKIDEGSRKWWVSATGDLATTSYTSAWTHTEASNGKPVTEKLVSQTTWARQPGGSWKNVMDINAVFPDPHL